jgi:serine/threonine protein phosphatase PrpC
MSVRVVETASTSSTGRVRRNNEDSYLALPPLFVVADGMGGALAGEVASRLCIEAFQDATPAAGDSDAAWLERTIEEANRRIVEHARAHPEAAGMGSTVTAGLVGEDRVAFGHVGDSRAYLLRDGALQQLSHDHSLVAELVRQGRITQQEAVVHPQRSVITRALGAEERVDVDAWSIDAADGDVFLLCSDGLTGMLPDERIAALLGAEGPLEERLRALVRAANEAGGDDNITAVAFRVAGSPDRGPAVAAAGGDTLSEVDAVPVVPAPRAGGPSLHEPAGSGRAGALRPVLAAVLGVALIAGLAIAGIVLLRWSHFVGVDASTGRVAVFSGLPVDLGGGHTLYRLESRSDVDAATLTPAERRPLLDHTLRSNGDALRLVQGLEAGQP